MAMPLPASSSAMASTWATLRRVIVVLTCTGIFERSGEIEHLHRPLEAPVEAAKGVVRGGIGAVEADAQRADAGLAHALERLEGGQRRGRGRQRRLQSEGGGVADQLRQIGPLQRIAAGEDQRRPARKSGGLLEQSLRLRRSKARPRAAVPAPTPGNACTPDRTPASLRSRTSAD